MNMISTGAFQTEMGASDRQLTLAEKFAAVWEKKNAKAARAGGLSLMALSLAACGSDDATTTTTATTTTATTTTTTTAVDAAKTMTLTLRDDTGASFTGGSGDDLYDGYSTSATLTNGDVLAGGEGTDTLAAYGITATVVPVTTGIEILELRGSGGSTSITMSSMTGVTNIVNDQSTGNVAFTKVAAGIAVEVQATAANNTTITMTDATGAADSLSISVSGDNGDLVADGVETVTVTGGATHGASTGASLDKLDSDALATVNVTSTANIDLGVVTQGGAAAKALTLDGSGAAAGFSADISDFNGTSAGVSSVGNTITGSASADHIEVDEADIDKYQTMTMGDGDDIIAFTDEFDTSETAKADWANISGFNTIELLAGTDAKGSATTSLDMTAAEGLDWVERVIMSTDVNGLFKDIKDDFILEIKAGASGSINTVNRVDTSTWEAGVNDMTLNLMGFSTLADANFTAQGTLTINSNGSGANQITSITGVTTPKVVITGAMNLDINNAVLSTGTVDVDASAMTGALLIEASTSATKIVGGSGADTLNGGAGADTITGGAGNDTILGDEAADTIDGGAGNDTITAMVHATLNDTVTTGTGLDTVKLEDHSTALAVAYGATTITDFDFGTATTTVDTLNIANSMIEAYDGGVGGGIAGSFHDSSANEVAAGDGTVVHMTTDGQTVANADIVVLSQTYATATAALAGMATAGLDTFNFGAALTDLDVMLVAFTDGTDSHIAATVADGGTNVTGGNTTSNIFDAIDVLATFSGVTSLANFNSDDVSIIA